jgi:hypothetical protein
MHLIRKTAASAAVLLCVAGCETLSGMSSSSPQTPAPASQSSAPAPAPRVNLTGYSASFKQGYADACAKRRNAQRFKADIDYSMGWQDGSSACRSR